MSCYPKKIIVGFSATHLVSPACTVLRPSVLRDASNGKIQFKFPAHRFALLSILHLAENSNNKARQVHSDSNEFHTFSNLCTTSMQNVSFQIFETRSLIRHCLTLHIIISVSLKRVLSFTFPSRSFFSQISLQQTLNFTRCTNAQRDRRRSCNENTNLRIQFT